MINPADIGLERLRRAYRTSPWPSLRRAEALQRHVEPLRLDVAPAAPARVNLLIPDLELASFFGGYIAAFNLAVRLTATGGHVRVVALGRPSRLPRDWQRTIEGYDGLVGFFDRVSIEFAADRGRRLEVSPDDTFIAYNWSTAHLAHYAARALGRERFVYLLQDYEVIMYPTGSVAALAVQAVDFPHFAVFSSQLLADYFRKHSLGVFAGGEPAGRRDSVVFENALTPTGPRRPEDLDGHPLRSVLFYARPEPHGARNLFEIGLLAMREAVGDGRFGDRWRFAGIGSLGGRRRKVRLAAGHTLELLPRRSQSSYAEVLRGYDVGLALMMTPHPSLVPLEMASAGMLTVTNTYENKTGAALAELSKNLIPVEPTIGGVKHGLVEAATSVDDLERRAAGSTVRWCTSWERAWSDEIVGRIKRFLET
jgi:hypothetical protein